MALASLCWGCYDSHSSGERPCAEELCNDLDDDCDGFVDEGLWERLAESDIRGMRARSLVAWDGGFSVVGEGDGAVRVASVDPDFEVSEDVRSVDVGESVWLVSAVAVEGALGVCAARRGGVACWQLGPALAPIAAPATWPTEFGATEVVAHAWRDVLYVTWDAGSRSGLARFDSPAQARLDYYGAASIAGAGDAIYVRVTSSSILAFDASTLASEGEIAARTSDGRSVLASAGDSLLALADDGAVGVIEYRMRAPVSRLDIVDEWPFPALFTAGDTPIVALPWGPDGDIALHRLDPRATRVLDRVTVRARTPEGTIAAAAAWSRTSVALLVDDDATSEPDTVLSRIVRVGCR